MIASLGSVGNYWLTVKQDSMFVAMRNIIMDARTVYLYQHGS